MGGQTSCCQCLEADSLTQPKPNAAADEVPPGLKSSVKFVLETVMETEMSDEEDERRLAAQAVRGKRKSVAGCSINKEDARNYVKPVYWKDSSAKARLQEIIRNNSKLQTLMGHLSNSTVDDIVNSFKPREALQGEVLIKQGDEGDCLFLIAEGEVDVFVSRPALDGNPSSGMGPKVASLESGSLFGELALLYQTPRAATVIATSSVVKLWQLDREPFQMLVVSEGVQRYDMYEGWLREVEVFKCLNQFELMQLTECLEGECFDAGETIFEQGAMGDRFYILESGSVAAYISGSAGEVEVKAYTKVGEYFGERALLKDEPRAAKVRAIGNGAEVVSLSKEDFTRMLGPIHEILIQHVDKYPRYAEMLK